MSSALRLVHLNTALIAALSLVACSGTIQGPSSVPSAPLNSLAIETNAVWQLRSIVSADGSLLTIADPRVFTLMLTDDGKVSARADCNRASGGYTLSGNMLSIGPIASTRAYCATAPVDQQFLMLLGGENIVTTSGATLQLSSSRGTLEFGR
jgi:heat shock protein HslJ